MQGKAAQTISIETTEITEQKAVSCNLFGLNPFQLYIFSVNVSNQYLDFQQSNNLIIRRGYMTF